MNLGLGSGFLEFGGNIAGLDISEPGLGPIKAKGRLIIKLNGLFMFGGNTAKVLMLAKLGQGVPRNKKPVKS